MHAKFLLIEDHVENRKLLTYLLERFGHQVRTADTAEEGLEIALCECIDLIICDIELPGIDGYEFAARLKSNQHWHQVPLIAVTALAMVGDRDKVLASGFDGYLSKPIAPQTFIQQIESFLPKAALPPSQVEGAVDKPIAEP